MDIKKHLAKHKISTAELGRAMGFSQQMAWLIANGKRKVPLSKLKLFEQVTGIPREQFRPELYK